MFLIVKDDFSKDYTLHWHTTQHMTRTRTSLSWSGSWSGRGNWGSRPSTNWSLAAVFPDVSMAALPLHLCHHLVSHLVSGPHVGAVPEQREGERQTTNLHHIIYLLLLWCRYTYREQVTVWISTEAKRFQWCFGLLEPFSFSKKCS